MYPSIAGSEPSGLHSPAGDGASSHHLGQNGPIAAFLIEVRVPGMEKQRSVSSLLWPKDSHHSVLFPITTQ